MGDSWASCRQNSLWQNVCIYLRVVLYPNPLIAVNFYCSFYKSAIEMCLQLSPWWTSGSSLCNFWICWKKKSIHTLLWVFQSHEHESFFWQKINQSTQRYQAIHIFILTNFHFECIIFYRARWELGEKFSSYIANIAMWCACTEIRIWEKINGILHNKIHWAVHLYGGQHTQKFTFLSCINRFYFTFDYAVNNSIESWMTDVLCAYFVCGNCCWKIPIVISNLNNWVGLLNSRIQNLEQMRTCFPSWWKMHLFVRFNAVIFDLLYSLHSTSG